MTALFDNPMGLMGFEFVEFASPISNVLEPMMEKLGFTLVAKHRSKDVVLYRQGDINFIVNREPNSPAAYFAAEHGPSACGLAFRVKDGCNLNPGDLLGTGTLSGPKPEQAASLMELTSNGKQPITLSNGEERGFLNDGDSIILRGYCQRAGQRRVGFGECRGTVLPARGSRAA
ncbi:fumarylacetoacetate hydrolase [Caballeronia calidae]|uniref:Fumarylacetoacetate hydrolase n=1 Tax=Caballeronia calidae TaxID=1777139 RepID=A0A158BZU3_9BURK|nr:fumarylacetoacetate hydrolase [Caballeronia calidae]